MKIIIFDTETTDLTKCFAYNVGYLIYDTETEEVLEKQDFVIEQIWHNLPLFETAYYAEKRPLYVSAMKGKKAKMLKFGYAMQRMRRAIADYGVECGYAYNSPFDERVFSYNCDWYKVSNPLDAIPVYDIRSIVHQSIAFSAEYQNFCDENHYYTEAGNYSTTAENVYRYLFNNDFEETHTALADSEIEAEILIKLIKENELQFGKAYKVYNSIKREGRELFVIDERKHNVVYNSEYSSIKINKNSDGVAIVLK